jgi:hypothetical protein
VPFSSATNSGNQLVGSVTMTGRWQTQPLLAVGRPDSARGCGQGWSGWRLSALVADVR